MDLLNSVSILFRVLIVVFKRLGCGQMPAQLIPRCVVIGRDQESQEMMIEMLLKFAFPPYMQDINFNLPSPSYFTSLLNLKQPVTSYSPSSYLLSLTPVAQTDADQYDGFLSADLQSHFQELLADQFTREDAEREKKIRVEAVVLVSDC